MELVLGIDLGTTGCRAVAFRADDGRRMDAAEIEYPLHSPRAGWAEQDAEQIYDAVLLALDAIGARRPAGAKVIGMGFSAALHSILPVDASGLPLHLALTWADGRAKEQMRRLAASVGALRLHARTGCPAHPMYPSAKIAWFRAERPELNARTASYLSIKDYVVRKLTGVHVTDRSLASASGLCALGGGWDPELLDLVGIDTKLLPEIASTTLALPRLSAESAARLGLPQETPVVLGAGDGMLANLGVGGLGNTQTVVTIGTSAAVRTLTRTPGVDDGGRTWCYNLCDDFWVRGGAVNNGGIVLRWFRDALAAQWPDSASQALGYDQICTAAARSPCGAGGLIFVPMLAGERTPYWNADARGVLLGLSLNTTREQIAKAVLEGVAFSVRDAFEALAKSVPIGAEVIATGSFTRSPHWVQIVSDVLGKPLALSAEQDASALGAAMLTLVGIGRLDLASAAALARKALPAADPDPKANALYNELFRIYQGTYQAACPTFAALAKLQSDSERNST